MFRSRYYGLRFQSSPDAARLAERLAGAITHLDAGAVACVLQGLQSIGDCAASRSVLRTVAKHLKPLRDERALTPRELSMALYGLRGFGYGPELARILGAFAGSGAAPMTGREVSRDRDCHFAQRGFPMLSAGN